MRPLSRLVFAAVLAVGGLSTASAQQLPPPQPPPHQPFRQVTSAPAPGPTSGTQVHVSPTTVVQQPVTPGFAPGYWPGVMSPAYGRLAGTAAVIDAQGQYQQSVQQARLLAEDVNRSQLDTRRSIIDQTNYEKSLQETAEQRREREFQTSLSISRNDPPLPRVRNGDALNDLLRNIQRMQLAGVTGPFVPLEPEVLQRVNVTTGVNPNNPLSVLGGGTLTWPVPLRAETFAAQRKQIDTLLAATFKQAEYGEVSAENARGLATALDNLLEDLKRQIADMSPSDYMTAKRYVGQVRDASRTLQQPNAKLYLNGTWRAQGKDVTELVANMSKNGLRFAPAAQGDDAFYTMLHRSLLTYDVGLTRLVAR